MNWPKLELSDADTDSDAALFALEENLLLNVVEESHEPHDAPQASETANVDLFALLGETNSMTSLLPTASAASLAWLAPRKDTDQMGEGTDDAAVAVITVTEQKAPRAELQHVDEAPPHRFPPTPPHTDTNIPSSLLHAVAELPAHMPLTLTLTPTPT